MAAFKALTKGQITKIALEYFQTNGVDCWRNNNTSPTKKRKFIGRYGVSDIIGIMEIGGEFFACEVKTENDRLSEEQRDFLIRVNKLGGFGYVAEDDKMGGVRYYLYINRQSEVKP